MGQRTKGERGYIPVRPPVTQLDFYTARADELGVAVGSYIVMRMAEADGLDVPDWVLAELDRAQKKRAAEAEERKQQQIAGLEELPAARAARAARIPRREQPLARSA